MEEEKERLKWFCLKSKSENIVKNYKSSFNNFCKWCKSYNLTSLPASDVSIALYLSSLARVSNSESKINLALYSIFWAHKLGGFTDPCSSNLVVSVKESVLRSIGKPICPKDPISVGDIAKIISHFGYSNLLDMCFATMSVISFAGFLRFNEVVKLKRHDVKIDDQQAKLLVHSSKTDQYSKGQHVIIARTGKNTCPVKLLERYVHASNSVAISDEYLFRKAYFCKKENCYKLRKGSPISYSRAREIFLENMNKIGLDPSKPGLHSLRSGGATSAASSGVSDRLLKKHGRWKSDKAKDCYVRESDVEKRSVSLNLGI